MARTGRPRAFDTDAALDAALLTFWRYGYEGTSLTALTEAMGINRPALYLAFGDKKGLFLRALDRYAAVYGAFTVAALDEPTACAVTAEYLRRWVLQLTNPEHPAGCFTVQTGLTCSAENHEIRDELARRRGLGEIALHERYERAGAEDDPLPAGQPPAALARFVSTVGMGLAVQAAGGAGRAELGETVRTALAVIGCSP
ncbi:TetR/AcrR family transcriptional regulator [Pseudonocardia sp. GCM10023141]|uniref:TetR/AcrR family transcriptional regulator n=1 Tax=Pseudonocardia sp. GCM10023141 TaxID=3252653 RepID=UPI00362135B3